MCVSAPEPEAVPASVDGNLTNEEPPHSRRFRQLDGSYTTYPVDAASAAVATMSADDVQELFETLQRHIKDDAHAEVLEVRAMPNPALLRAMSSRRRQR